jgi:creatinine amidohydrolase
MSLNLGDLTTTDLRVFLATADRPVVLWPVGSTEPHGPHLPLATDIILARHNALEAAEALRSMGIHTLVAPDLPYGVTDFAAGFTGAISIPEDTLVDFIVAGATTFLRDGFAHVCLINHHLEPGQLSALQRAHDRLASNFSAGAVSFPKVVSRRWGAQLGEEFRSGACHAGEYEGSLVMAATPTLFRSDRAEELPPVNVSLSKAIKAGQNSFLEAGADAAYTGSPSKASVAEGKRLYAVLAAMVVTEVKEHLEQLS